MALDLLESGSGVLLIKRILGQVRRAVQDFNMISEGDRIAVGVSGGKDSMTLLTVLSRLREFYPLRFDIVSVTVSMGLDGCDLSPIRERCGKLGVECVIEDTYIGKIVFEARKEENPCSLCANLRRGALNSTAKRLGCNKVALAHNRDDLIETLLMSAFYEGRLHTFSPVTHLDRTGLNVIRPLIYTEEKQIKGFIKAKEVVVVSNPCPANGNTKREFVKKLLMELSMDNREIKSNLFGAIKRSKIDGWYTNVNGGR